MEESKMGRAVAHFSANHWPSEQATDGVTLAFDDRHRRRIRLTTDGGEAILLDLPKAKAMAHGCNGASQRHLCMRRCHNILIYMLINLANIRPSCATIF